MRPFAIAHWAGKNGVRPGLRKHEVQTFLSVRCAGLPGQPQRMRRLKKEAVFGSLARRNSLTSDTQHFNIRSWYRYFHRWRRSIYLDGITAACACSNVKNISSFIALLLYAKFDSNPGGSTVHLATLVPIGVPISVYNILRAKEGNKAMSKEFEKYSVFTVTSSPAKPYMLSSPWNSKAPKKSPLQISIRENSKMWVKQTRRGLHSDDRSLHLTL